jgi:uncharacterized membrane protein (Fun14 family)
MVVDTLTSLIPQGGFPLAGGALIGAVMGYACRKLIKLAIIGVGLILALLAYLQYQGLIKVNWTAVQTQTTNLVQTSSQKIMDLLNNTAHQLNQHNLNLNHMDMAYPVLGGFGFIPGFIFGLSRG